jgi:DNA-binding winged helix-turn-helix (wHTH) protein
MRSEVIFRFGEFTFDSGSRLLVLGETRQHLSPKAQQLLQLLLMARPRALSRQDLYDALWPSTFVCETNLASIVNEVRRALGDDARAPKFIRTVHGFGYAFGAEVAVMAPVTAQARLMCAGMSYPLYKGENSIGRSPDSHVVLSDGTISRRHAAITIHDDGDTCFIRDLESTNGTYVDGQRIGSKQVLVRGGTVIGLGAAVASIKFRKISTTMALRLNMAELKRQVAERISSPV